MIDRDLGLHWLHMAAARGCSEAQLELGLATIVADRDDTLPLVRDEAVTWLRLASLQVNALI
jgi:hypothetical protein